MGSILIALKSNISFVDLDWNFNSILNCSDLNEHDYIYWCNVNDSKIKKFTMKNLIQKHDDYKKKYSLCPICKNKMILMSSIASFQPDDEPYESGKQEEVPNIDTIEKSLNAFYCIKCEHIEINIE